MSTVTLLPHQQEVLKQTDGLNRVTIRGYEGLYEIDSNGNVYFCKGILKPHVKNGYLAVNLTKNKICKHYYIHRLVAEAFIPNPNGFREVNHINCDKHNNSVDNLEWCDRKRNLQHSYEHGLKRCGETHGCHKLTEKEVMNIRKEYVKGDREHSLHALGKKYGVSYSTIQAIVKGRLWSYLKEGDIE